MFSIIETGGKQYKVKAGDKIKIEKLDGEKGNEVVFDKVLLSAASEEDIKVGQPYVEGVKVVGEITNQERAKKLIVYKYKPKKRLRTKKGHRQPFTEILIKNMDSGK